MAIDFGAFGQGAASAKKDYWADVRNSQQSLIRDVAVQDGLQQMRDMADKEAASSYLAPLLVDQQRAAASGVQSDEWYQRATQSILNDEGFKNMPVEQQQHVMNNLRAQGVTIAQKLAESGDNERALTLNKSLGLQFGPENRASPTDVFNTADLASAGFVNDAEAGVWRGPNGQVIPAFQGAEAVTLQGQPGMTRLLADQAEMQRQQAEGVRRGTHVEMTDANGVRTYRTKTPIELQLDADRQADSYRQNKIAESIRTGALNLTNPDSVRLFVMGTNDPMMGPAIAAYSQQPPAAVIPQAVVTPVVPATPVAAAQPYTGGRTFTPPATAAPALTLDPKFIQGVNPTAPAAATPIQQAIAADVIQNSPEVEDARLMIDALLTQRNGALTAQDSADIESLLRAYPALQNDATLMQRLGVEPQ